MKLTAGLVLLALACSSASQLPSLPPALVDKALCSLEVVEALPADPEQISVEDLKNAKREYRACLEAPDAGAQ